ncbi:MAG: hypothetical protein K8L99_25935, partial [Anaerolineae bacterium]|nr:hypothetical protein [Anaerolineae bacterium]
MIPMLLAVLAFGVIHSLLAGQSAKQALRQRLGNYTYHGLYRLLYNLLAVVTLLPAAYLILFRSGAVVWQITGWAAILCLVIQVVGLIGLSVSLLQIDLGQFTGLSQLLAYLRGQSLPLPTEPLQVNGVYRLVRHPLYLFSLMVIWPVLTMTESLLAFNIGATVY